MYAKQLILSQIRAVAAAARPATAARLSSTFRPDREAIIPDGSLARDSKESWSDLAEGARGGLGDTARGSVPRSAGQAAEQVRDAAKQQAAQSWKQVERSTSDLAQQARGAAAQAVGGAKAAARNASNKRANPARNPEALLSETIDVVAEDKLASSPLNNPGASRRPKSPVRPQDVRVATAQQESNINDLVDELEDKVRNLDHVKKVVSKSRDGRFAQRSSPRQQQQSRRP